MNGEERFVDEVDIDNIAFHLDVKKAKQKAVVTIARSTGLAFFNGKMCKLLNIGNWKNVIVGLDRRTGIVVFKEADVEEYGAVSVRRRSEEYLSKYPSERGSCRISVKHLTMSVRLGKVYRGQREGLLVLLKEVK